MKIVEFVGKKVVFRAESEPQIMSAIQTFHLFHSYSPDKVVDEKVSYTLLA